MPKTGKKFSQKRQNLVKLATVRFDLPDPKGSAGKVLPYD
jgi:hypothetical protein